MKKLFSLLFIIFFVKFSFAQAPQQMNYQGVARNSAGSILPAQTISLRLSIHDGSAAGVTVYSETRQLTTNQFGLFNVAIGSPGASSVSGSVATVNWASGSKYFAGRN